MVNLYSYITNMEKQKNILIIGASSEIAQAIIQKLNDQDYTIISTSRSGEGTNFKLDLTDIHSVTEFEKAALQTSFDWILYCAGMINPQESTETFDGEYGARSQLVNFTSAARILTTLALNVQKGGGIMALSSTAGIWGSPLYPIYSAWKAALNIFMQTLHKKMKEIHIHSICPGPTNTKMRQSLAGDAAEHQSPSVVADHIVKVMEHSQDYKEYPILVIRNDALYTLEQELRPLL